VLVNASAVGQEYTTATHEIVVLLRLDRGIPTRAKCMVVGALFSVGVLLMFTFAIKSL
jgi:hypothetical protein